MSNLRIARIIIDRGIVFERIAKRVEIRPESVSIRDSQSNTLAWREALVHSIPQVYGLFVRHRIHPALAEELTQKTIFDAVSGRESFESRRGKFASWLIGIAHNNLALEMRQRARRPKLDGDISRYLEKIDSELLPDEILEREETAELVRGAMDRLDGKERAVLKAKYDEEQSARTIAERMNMTEKAVHSLLYRARNSLREKLKNIEV